MSHPYLIGQRDWWACDEPERPFDEHIVYLADCPKCQMKARADVLRAGEWPVITLGGSHERLSDLAAGQLDTMPYIRCPHCDDQILRDREHGPY